MILFADIVWMKNEISDQMHVVPYYNFKDLV